MREFARAVFADAPQHTDVEVARAAGFSDVVAPPTFAMVIQDLTLQQLLAQEDSGIVLARTIHAEQRFTYTRPIVAGDELTAQLRQCARVSVIARRTRSSEAAITDAAGDHVVTATSVLLVGAESTDEGKAA